MLLNHSMAPGVPQTMNDFAVKIAVDGATHIANTPSQSSDDGFSLVRVKSLELRKQSLELIGVVLVTERAVGKNVLTTDSRHVVLGTVCIESTRIYLDELRRMMCAELPYLPASFNFLTKYGWPIHKIQEHKIKSSHVVSENNCISIKKEYDKSRVGIVSSTGEPVGFIFTDLNINVKQLRETIEQQLKLNANIRSEYRFMERNGWPVMPHQEPALNLFDIMVGQIVCIQMIERIISTPTDPVRPTSLAYTRETLAIENQNQLPSPQENVEHEPVKRKKSFKFYKPDYQYSVKIRKESEKKPRTKTSMLKPILISYVRAEAAQYALDLKRELVELGFNVYLDVHEIKTGSDWQDALNHAVTHCFLFVPLITARYGKTVWTNREVKLADVLGKMIIPVNFMEHWPPPQLAIQFASTQYIPWKLPESDHVKGESEKMPDSKEWDPVFIKRVSKQIAECYKDYLGKQPKRTPSSREVAPSICKTLSSARGEDIYSVPEYVDVGKQSIVITAHPRQRYIAEDLKLLFEKNGHEVWCSVELLDQKNLVFEDMDPNTPCSLPTIQEGDVFFSEKDEVLDSISDKKSSMFKDTETFGKRPLSRLMSQFSDISQPTTLSQEKIDKLRTFQQKVDQAAVVIVLISEAYTKSTFSHQQVFYCEHRKRVVLVKCDSSPIPKWFRLLMGNDVITKVNNSQFESILTARVTRAVNPSSSETPKDAIAEAKMNYLVNFLKKNLPLKDLCVYVAGSSKLQTQRAEEICRAVGKELAKVDRVSLVTGGFYGAADITAKTFSECRENSIDYIKDDPNFCDVVHILPMRDSEDLTAKARQNLADGSFEAIPYGKTVFLGDSVKERETVVARLLDTCLVIEGGPGVVHEVEEFIWNDHFVIPIMSTGGAAGGNYGVPLKIFEKPPGVDKADWSVLSEKNASPEEVAKAVVNIMISLKKSLVSPTCTLQKPPLCLRRKSKKRLKSRKYRLQESDLKEIDISLTSTPVPLTSIKNVFELTEVSEVSQCSSEDINRTIIQKRRSWWRKFINIFKKRRSMSTERL